MSSHFSQVELAPADPILGLTEAFQADTRADKVNLGVGVYLDEDGKLPLMQCIRAAEERLAAEPKAHSYLGIVGLPGYNQAVKELVFGADEQVLNRVSTVQSLGGTGALKTGADFLRRNYAEVPVLISDPSWENHRQLFTQAGFDVQTYRYYDPAARGIDVDGMLNSLSAAPRGSIVVLHACCHNPTGYDLTSEQWDQVIEVLQAQGHLPFVDMAYQGFAEGIREDGALIAKLVAAGMEFVAATSFSKSMGLYGQRVGAFHAVAQDAEAAKRVLSQVKICIRTNFSNPPTYGAALAHLVLTDAGLRQQWEQELGQMRERIGSLRRELVSALESKGIDSMGFVAQQRGMFSYSGLTKEQMVRLREEHGVYGTDAGRVCVAGLNATNLDYVASALANVLQ